MRSSRIALSLASLLSQLQGIVSATTPIDIGSSTQLFADDYLVASVTAGLIRRMHTPHMTPIIRPDAAWETGFAIGTIGTSVVQAGDKLRLYYSLRNATLGCGHG